MIEYTPPLSSDLMRANGNGLGKRRYDVRCRRLSAGSSGGIPTFTT
jgi:hypothetical protein